MVQYILYASIIGFMGWVYESLIMSIWTGKWENRGFLFGPLLPIYAIGGLATLIVFDGFMPTYSIKTVFFIGLCGSAILEFSTSLILEKVFRKTWWDYSICPFNVQGRICAPASVGFGTAAVFFVYILNPRMVELISKIPPYWASKLANLCVAIFFVDMVLTIIDLTQRSIELRIVNKFNDHMDKVVAERIRFEKTPSERMHEWAEKRQ